MTVTIFHSEVVPGDIILGQQQPDKIKAIMAVPTGTPNQWYQWTDAAIPDDTADLQAYVNANETQYRTEAASASTSAIGQTQFELLVDLWRHVQYQAVFDSAGFQLRNGMYNAAVPPTVVTVAAYRAVLDTVEQYLADELGTTIFDRSYKNDRIAAVGTADASTFTTLTQCVNCHNVLERWLLHRAIAVERIQSTGVLNQ